MSTRLIARSPDLSRLREEGYEVRVRDDHVVIANVPYVDSQREVGRGSMVIALTTSGECTGPPPDHTVWWAGSMPCHQDGTPISRIDAGAVEQELAPGLTVQHRFSSKPQPAGRYDDYHAQFTAYIRLISHEAQAIDPDATAATFAPVEAGEEESVFRYHDSASSRAGIKMASAKLELGKVAIVGVGGTGSYVLDLVAKTPVGEIHLFDDDVLLNHNAFRAPGAASLPDLQERPLKVEYFASIYDRMRRQVIAHPVRLGAANADALAGVDFVFLCMDGGPDKRALIGRLEALGIAFIDVGMGLDEQDGSIGGILRVTTSTPRQRQHVWDFGRISFEDPDDEANEYARNIQVADLNSLNACLAVIRWKRLFGFYRDLENEHHSLYTIDGNHLLNEDQA
jgi:hypothetical protein